MRTNSAPQSPPADKEAIEKIKKQQIAILRLNWLTQKGLEQDIKNKLANKEISPNQRYSLLLELVETIREREAIENDEHFPAAKELQERLDAAEAAGTKKNTQLKEATDTSGLALWFFFKIEQAHRQQHLPPFAKEKISKQSVSRTLSR